MPLPVLLHIAGAFDPDPFSFPPRAFTSRRDVERWQSDNKRPDSRRVLGTLGWAWWSTFDPKQTSADINGDKVSDFEINEHRSLERGNFFPRGAGGARTFAILL
jgi:hypothetical protein